MSTVAMYGHKPLLFVNQITIHYALYTWTYRLNKANDFCYVPSTAAAIHQSSCRQFAVVFKWPNISDGSVPVELTAFAKTNDKIIRLICAQ